MIVHVQRCKQFKACIVPLKEEAHMKLIFPSHLAQ